MNFANLFQNEPEPRRGEAGTVLIKAEDKVGNLLVLLEGSAEIIVGNDVVETVEVGGVVGELEMIGARRAVAEVRAKTDVVLAEVDERRFLFLIQEHPTFALDLMRVMANRIEAMNARSLDLSSASL